MNESPFDDDQDFYDEADVLENTDSEDAIEDDELDISEWEPAPTIGRKTRRLELTDSAKNRIAGAAFFVVVGVSLLGILLGAPHYIGYCRVTSAKYRARAREIQMYPELDFSGYVLEEEASE